MSHLQFLQSKSNQDGLKPNHLYNMPFLMVMTKKKNSVHLENKFSVTLFCQVLSTLTTTFVRYCTFHNKTQSSHFD